MKRKHAFIPVLMLIFSMMFTNLAGACFGTAFVCAEEHEIGREAADAGSPGDGQGSGSGGTQETTAAEEETSAPAAEETTSAGEETTAAEEETTAEETTAAGEETTAAEEETTAATEETTAAEEETTAEETTAAEEETTAEETTAAEETTTAEEATAAEETTAAGNQETTAAETPLLKGALPNLRLRSQELEVKLIPDDPQHDGTWRKGDTGQAYLQPEEHIPTWKTDSPEYIQIDSQTGCFTIIDSHTGTVEASIYTIVPEPFRRIETRIRIHPPKSAVPSDITIEYHNVGSSVLRDTLHDTDTSYTLKTHDELTDHPIGKLLDCWLHEDETFSPGAPYTLALYPAAAGEVSRSFTAVWKDDPAYQGPKPPASITLTIEPIKKSHDDDLWRVGDRGRVIVNVQPEGTSADVTWSFSPIAAQGNPGEELAECITVNTDGSFEITAWHRFSNPRPAGIKAVSALDETVSAVASVRIPKEPSYRNLYYENVIPGAEESLHDVLNESDTAYRLKTQSDLPNGGAGYTLKAWRYNEVEYLPGAPFSYSDAGDYNARLTAVWANAPESIEVSITPISALPPNGWYAVGESGKASASISPSGAGKGIKWSAGNGSFVSIDDDGTFTVTAQHDYDGALNIPIVASSILDPDIKGRATITLAAPEKYVKGLRLIKQPTKRIYEAGEYFDPAGLVIELEYLSGRKGESRDGENFTYQIYERGTNIPLITSDELIVLFHEYYAGPGSGAISIPIVVKDPSEFPHEVKLITGSNGTASVSADSAMMDTPITVTATPDDDYELDRITWKTVNGSETDITESCSFTMPAEKVTVHVTFREKPTPVYVPAESSPTDQISLTKILHGRTLKKGEFRFEMEGRPEGTYGSTKPTGMIYKGTHDENGTISFPKVSFTEPGIYSYLIEEKGIGTHGRGMSYDDTPRCARATVTDTDANGILEISWELVQDMWLGGEVFENRYHDGEVTDYFGGIDQDYYYMGYSDRIVYVKLSGRKTEDGELGIRITGPKLDTVVKAGGRPEGTDYRFNYPQMPEITFTRDDMGGEYTKTFEYEVRMVDGGLPGVTYDKNVYTFVATVVDYNPAQSLQVSWSIKDTDDPYITFYNDYRKDVVYTDRNPDSPNAVRVTKKVEGSDAAGGAEFSIAPAGDTVRDVEAWYVIMPDDLTARVETLTNGSSQTAAFDRIKFNVAGVYTFTITETSQAPDEYWIYDNTPRSVEIVVTDIDAGGQATGALRIASIKYDGSEQVPVFINRRLTATLEGTVEWDDGGLQHNNAEELAGRLSVQYLNSRTLTWSDIPKDAYSISWNADRYTISGIPLYCENSETAIRESYRVVETAPEHYTVSYQNVLSVSDEGGAHNGGSIINKNGRRIITLNGNGGTVNGDAIITMTSGQDGTLSRLPEAVHPDPFMEFLGWFTEREGGTPVEPDTVFTNNTEIYAQWKDNTPSSHRFVIQLLDCGVPGTAFDTKEKAENELLSKLGLERTSAKGSWVSYQIKMQIEQNGQWIDADRLPSYTGLVTEVILPYPSGTGQSGTFKAVQMFTKAMFGYQPGQTTIPQVTNTANGIRIALPGQSVLLLYWEGLPDDNGGDDDDDDNGGDNDDGGGNDNDDDGGNEDNGNNDGGNDDDDGTGSGSSFGGGSSGSDNKTAVAQIKENFDSRYYADNNPDVKLVFGYNHDALWNHYVIYGRFENRRVNFVEGIHKNPPAVIDSIDRFNYIAYADRYPDLKLAFGYRKPALWDHYLTYGRRENRIVE